MEPDLIETVINSGIATVLAVVVIYWNRVDSRERIDRERERTEEAKQHARDERDDKLLLISIVEKNTQAMGELRAAIRRSNGPQ